MDLVDYDHRRPSKSLHLDNGTLGKCEGNVGLKQAIFKKSSRNMIILDHRSRVRSWDVG